MGLIYSCPGCFRLINHRGYCADCAARFGINKVERAEVIETPKPKPFATAARHNEQYYRTHRWRQLRKLVLERDGYRCCYCGSTNKLSVHHVIEGQLDEDTFFNPEILITLCSKCHNTLSIQHGNRLKKK